MRVLCLNKRHEYEFTSPTTNYCLAFGDLDNDGYSEFVIGNDKGEVLIFKGREIWQKFTKLGFVSCLTIGDILNEGKNCLVVVTGDGFCHIYDSEFDSDNHAIEASEELAAAGPKDKHLIHIRSQRVPANVKDILLGDIDGDGKVEMVLGLTDRVVRSYRWSSGKTPRPSRSGKPDPDRGRAKLIALNKWECAKQIGSITLHHNWEGKPCILVSQPGGTFMRIRCHADGSPSLKDKGAGSSSTRSSSPENAQQSTVDYQSLGLSRMRSPNVDTEILGDIAAGMPVPRSIYDTSTFLLGSTVQPSKRAMKKMQKARSHKLKTTSSAGLTNSPASDTGIDSSSSLETSGQSSICEVTISSSSDAASGHSDTASISTQTTVIAASSTDPTKESASSVTSISESRSRPYAVATLDGTIMLVQDEVILWALAVDHQIFTMQKMDINGDSLDEIVACAWDGQVYIIDQNKTCVKFNFGEPVKAFACGMFSGEIDRPPQPALAFVTFKKRLYIYYDVNIKQMAIEPFKPDLRILSNYYVDENTNLDQAMDKVQNLSEEERKKLVSLLLYKRE